MNSGKEQKHIKNRKVKKGSGLKVSSLKRVIMTFGWAAMVVVALFYVARFFFRDVKASLTPDAEIVADGLLDVLPFSVEDGEIINYPGHRVYYNSKYKIPNCVVYELLGSETDGPVPRYKNFEPDPNVYESAETTDYIRSGYDRGHMAPAGDMKWDYDAMHATFYMSNICPQAKDLNTNIWNRLEMNIRRWAIRDSAIVVACGPIMGKDVPTIGANEVGVPEKFFKVLLSAHTTPAKAIAFVFPNGHCSKKMKEYAITVDSLESITGYDFFSELPDSVENKIETICNYKAWTVR